VVLGMPVFHEGRVYVSVGGDIWHGKPKARLVCIDASRSGDITKGGEVWSAPMGRHCVSTPAIRDGLVYMADCSRTIHCLEASTGQSLWTHKAQGEIWASALVADGKVFIGSKAGDFWILKAGREKAILSTVDLDDMSGSPVAANGTLYIATMSRLIAAAVGVAPAASTTAPAVAPAASGAATP